MKRAYWQTILNGFFFVIMGVGLYFIVVRSGVDHFWEALSHVSFGLGFIVITLNVLGIFIAALRFLAIVRSTIPGVSRVAISKIHIIALASGYANIGKLNAPIKAILLKKEYGVPFSNLIPMLIAEPGLDLCALIMIAVLSFAFADSYREMALPLLITLGWNRDRITGFIVKLMLIGILVLLVLWIAKRKIRALEEMLFATARLYKDKKMLLASAFYTALLTFVNIFTITNILYFLHLKTEPGLVLLLYSVPVIAGLFSPVPGGLGVREFVFASIYTFCCGTGSTAVVATLLIRLGFFAALPISFGLLICIKPVRRITLLCKSCFHELLKIRT